MQIANRSSVNCLHVAAKNNNQEITNLLLKNNINLNCLDSCKDTPLHVAVQHNYLDIVRILLKNKKCKRKIKNRKKLTALELAENLNHKDIVKFIKDYETFFLKVSLGKSKKKKFLNCLCCT